MRNNKYKRDDPVGVALQSILTSTAPWERRRPRRLTNEQVEHKRRIARPCHTLPEFVTVHASQIRALPTWLIST